MMKLRVKTAAAGKRPIIVEADDTWSIEQLKAAIRSKGIAGDFELSLNGSVKLEGAGSLKRCGLVGGDLLFVMDECGQKDKGTEENRREGHEGDRAREAPLAQTVASSGGTGAKPHQADPEAAISGLVPDLTKGAEVVAMDTGTSAAATAALSSRNNFEKLLNSSLQLLERSCGHVDVVCLAVDSLMLDSGFIPSEEAAARSLSSCPGHWRHAPHGVHRFKYRSVLNDAVLCNVVCVKMESMLSVHASLLLEKGGKFSCSLQLPLTAFGRPGSVPHSSHVLYLTSVVLQNTNTLSRTVKDQLVHNLVTHIRKELGLPEVGTLMSLPVEVKLYLMQFLDLVAVLAVGAVCKELHLLTKDEFVWKHLCLRQFGDQLMFASRNQQLTWKELYMTQYMQRKERDRQRATYYQPPPPLTIGRVSPPFPNLPDFPGMIGGSYDLMPDPFRPALSRVPYGTIPHPAFPDPSSIGPPYLGPFPGTRPRPSPYPSPFPRPRGPFGGMRF